MGVLFLENWCNYTLSALFRHFFPLKHILLTTSCIISLRYVPPSCHYFFSVSYLFLLLSIFIAFVDSISVRSIFFSTNFFGYLVLLRCCFRILSIFLPMIPFPYLPINLHSLISNFNYASLIFSSLALSLSIFCTSLSFLVNSDLMKII